MSDDKRKKKEQAREVEDDQLAGMSGGVEKVSGPVESEERPQQKKELFDNRLG